MSQAPKRVIDQDPDYESIPLHTQQKRIKLHEQDAKEAAVRKIEQIVRSQFSNEISSREAELELINQRIYQAQVILDRLRVGIITKYYAGGGNALGENFGGAASSTTQQGGWQDSQQALASVHPTTRQYLGKAPPASHHGVASSQPLLGQDESHRGHQGVEQKRTPLTLVASESSVELTPTLLSRSNGEPGTKERVTANGGSCDTAPRIGRGPRCKTKVRIIVGNVSKYIPLDRRDGGGGGEQTATHKWLAYVRTAPGEPRCIGELVRHVRFFLHPSYRPHDLVQVTEAPFQVQRKGWGEFPLRVQLHFHDRWTKHVDIIHHLKLDKTYTGLQTLGAETVVDLWLPSSATELPEAPSSANVDVKPPGVIREKALVESGRTESSESMASGADKAETEASSGAGEGIVIPADSAELQCTSEAPDGSTLAAVSSELSSRQVETVEQNNLDVISAVDDHSGVDTSCLVPIDTATPAMLDENNPTNAVHQIETSASVAVPTTPPILTAATPPVSASVASVAPPKLLLPKSPTQNGVIPTSFVKCTDALGRVLLIPATSLLSPKTTPGKPQVLPKQPSLLQPAAVLSGTGVPNVAAPKGAATKTVCLGPEASSKPAVGTANVKTTVVRSLGVPHTKAGPAVAIAPRQGTLLPKSAAKASLVALAPAGTPGGSGVLASNILASGHKLASIPNDGGVKILSSAGPATSPSALRVIRPALPSATVPPNVTSSSNLLLTPNSVPGLVRVTAVSPVVRPSVAVTAVNQTSLLSVVCNKPGVTGANVATPIPSATVSAPPIATAVMNNAVSDVCNRTVSQMADVSTLSTVSSAPAAGSTAGVSTYTFVVLPGQNQIVLLPAGAVSAQDAAARISAVQEKPSSMPSVPSGSLATVVSPAAVLQGQPEKVDLAKELQERLDAIRLSECKDVRSALLAVAAHFPLVGVSADEKLSCFPYAALDSATFFSWPLPKRRSSEWMRACDVRRTLERLLEHQHPAWFAPSSAGSSRGLPSKRSIVLLCRRFGFTPLHSDVDSQPEEVEMSGVEPSEHNSYSEPTELIARLADAASAVEEGSRDGAGDGEDEVDIDGLDRHEEPDDAPQPHGARTASEQGVDTSTSATAATPHGSSASPEKCLLRKAKVHLPLSPAAAFVREAAAEVGIHLTGCELEPRIDVPVVEEMMVSACKNFATALLRNAVDAAFRRTRLDRTPSLVTLEDTYQGILRLPECSFLTNEHLGIEATREGEEAHV